MLCAASEPGDTAPCRVVVLGFRQAPQAGPYPGRRPSFEQDAVLRVAQHQHDRAARRQRTRRFAFRQQRGQVLRVRDAVAGERALAAARARMHADGGAEIHYRLGVVGDACLRRLQL